MSWETKCEIFWWVRFAYYLISVSALLWAPCVVFTLIAAWAC